MEKVRLLFSFLLITALYTGCGKMETNAEADSAETTVMIETVSSETETVPETTEESETETTEMLTEAEKETEQETIPETESETVISTEGSIEVLSAQAENPEAPAAEAQTEAETEPQAVAVSNLKVSTISVSCLKVTWDSDRDCTVTVDTKAPYQENIYFYFKEKNLLYLTGLRENNEYTVHVTPNVAEGETVTGHAEQVVVIYNFDEDPEAYAQYKDSGVLYATDFFAGERASGLTAQPASGAIAGSVNDPITDTGICRDEYGDYCAAMRVFFGHDWDRYLITFQNGQQITVKQCDDKGYRWYHTVGGDDTNMNIIEFIWYGASAPSGVMYTGTWGSFFWNGFEFSHVQSIQKINYPDNPVEY